MIAPQEIVNIVLILVAAMLLRAGSFWYSFYAAIGLAIYSLIPPYPKGQSPMIPHSLHQIDSERLEQLARYYHYKNCTACTGDCSSANPPVAGCPKEDDEVIKLALEALVKLRQLCRGGVILGSGDISRIIGDHR